MKKILLLLIVCSSFAYGQSARLQLIEEFTGENCGPCASTNPAFNTLLDANAANIVAIKYQVNIPSAGPMYYHNSTDVDTRRSYYGVNSAPNARHDGVTFGPAGSSGHPANFTQAMINARTSVTSPFDIQITRSYSTNYDSIYVTAVVTASEATSGALACHIAIIERDIYFDKAPGTNGEKHFEGVMKKMLPSAAGTTLATSFTVGQTETITAKWKFSNVYDLNQIAVVAFVQNKTTKAVLQAKYSAPQPLAVDAASSNISSVPLFSCNTDFTPSFTLTNLGANTLTSATINYKVDNNTPSTQSWSGSLASGDTAIITLPTISSTTGQHNLLIYATDLNGGIDYNVKKDTAKFTMSILTSVGASPDLTQNFESSSTFPGTDWIIVNSGGPGWERYSSASGGGFGTSASSVKLNFNGSSANELDDMVMPNLDFTSVTSPKLYFDFAYTNTASGKKDSIIVLTSIDCGATWTTRFKMGGTTMATAPENSSTFFYPTASQWTKYTVDLSALAGANNVVISVRGKSGGYGNNGFIDNLSTTPPVLSSAKDITMFKFTAPSATGTISGTDITLTVPAGTDKTSLVATFTKSSLSTVKVGATTQVSGTTPNDFTSPVTYTVTAEDASTQDYTVTVVEAATGIEQNSSINGLTVYPNPAEKFITINGKGSSLETKIIVSNLIGETVKELTLAPSEFINTNIDISAQPAGIYFVKIQNSSESVIQKVIKK